MELTGGADCGALEGDEKSERVEEEASGGGSVRVERLVRLADNTRLFEFKEEYQDGAPNLQLVHMVRMEG